MGTYDEAPDAVRAWLEAGADAIDLVLPLGLPVEQLHRDARGRRARGLPRGQPKPRKGDVSSPRFK